MTPTTATRIVYICAWCGKPLDDRSARWIAEDRQPLQVSHGICRDCSERVFRT